MKPNKVLALVAGIQVLIVVALIVMFFVGYGESSNAGRTAIDSKLAGAIEGIEKRATSLGYTLEDISSRDLRANQTGLAVPGGPEENLHDLAQALTRARKTHERELRRFEDDKRKLPVIIGLLVVIMFLVDFVVLVVIRRFRVDVEVDVDGHSIRISGDQTALRLVVDGALQDYRFGRQGGSLSGEITGAGGEAIPMKISVSPFQGSKVIFFIGGVVMEPDGKGGLIEVEPGKYL